MRPTNDAIVLGMLGTLWWAGVTLAATPKEIASATDLEVCDQALNLTKNDWNLDYSSRQWLGEANKRRLGLSQCMSLLGKPVDELTNVELCELALDAGQRNWDLSYSHRTWLAEVEQRRLSVADCRNLMGVTLPDVTRASSVEVCKHAINESGDGWNTAFQSKFWRAEVNKRMLSLEDCTALLVAGGIQPEEADENEAGKTTDFRYQVELAMSGSCYSESRAEKRLAKFGDDAISDFCSCLAKRFVGSLSDSQLALVTDEEKFKRWMLKAKNAALITRASEGCQRQHLTSTASKSTKSKPIQKKQQKKKKEKKK
jgi:hypothetical protein